MGELTGVAERNYVGPQRADHEAHPTVVSDRNISPRYVGYVMRSRFGLVPMSLVSH